MRSSALIVGGSSGIGLATARLLLERDIPTVILGRSQQKLAAATHALAGFSQVETLQADLRDSNSLQRVIAYAADHSRHIKYLLNAAGYFKPTPFLEHTSKDYDTYMELNRAAFFISQAVAKNMVANGGGSIVNIG